MTVREMHIELEQSLNQIAAHKTRKYLPEEKDWILTKMQERLIQASLTPRTDGTGGFEINQLYADRIQPLIVSHKPLVPYIDEGKDRYKCFLPADYQYLISNWSYTKVLCEGVTPTIGSTSLTLYALRQNLSGKPTVPYYTTMSVVNGTTVTIPDDLPFFNKYSGYNKKEDVSFLVPVVCQKGGYYWERFGDIVKQGCYLSVVATDTPITPTLTIDGDDKTSVSSQVIPLTYHIGQGTLVSNRMMASNKIPLTRSAAFFGSNYYSPISELSNGMLYVYRDGSFTVSDVALTYVRKCLPISLSLGSNSELPEAFHQQICDLAVEYMKGRLDDPQGVQLVENDNNTRVRL